MISLISNKNSLKFFKAIAKQQVTVKIRRAHALRPSSKSASGKVIFQTIEQTCLEAGTLMYELYLMPNSTILLYSTVLPPMEFVKMYDTWM